MGYFKDKQPFRVEFSPPMSVVNIVSNSIIYLYFLGDAPYSSPSAQTPSVPVGVPPGLEYLTQVVLLSLLFSRFHENASMHLITKHGHFKISDWPGPHSPESWVVGGWVFVYTSLGMTIYSNHSVSWGQYILSEKWFRIRQWKKKYCHRVPE